MSTIVDTFRETAFSLESKNLSAQATLNPRAGTLTDNRR